jgi:hypothetical protein
VVQGTGSLSAASKQLGSGTVTFTMLPSTAAACSDEGEPPLVSVCTWSASGSFALVGCMSGIISAPSSSTSVTMGADTDTYSLTVVVVAGVGVIAGAEHDDNSAAITGSVAGVALLIAKPTQNCVAGITDFVAVLDIQATSPVVLPSPYPR